NRDDNLVLRRSGACGLLHADAREFGGPIEWPCAHETRECVYDAGCSADKCASCCETRREKCVKTSTWWGKKKAGKGTQRGLGSQADTRRVILVCENPSPVDNPRALGIDSLLSRVACA